MKLALFLSLFLGGCKLDLAGPMMRTAAFVAEVAQPADVTVTLTFCAPENYPYPTSLPTCPLDK